jgi:hypothetical protein
MNSRLPTCNALLRKLYGVIGILLLPLPGYAQATAGGVAPSEDKDEQIFSHVMQSAATKNLAAEPIASVVADVGLSFQGTPYVAHTLEAPGEEHLVVNLRELDCTTFMENALVLARCVKLGKQNFDDYKKELKFVRYRGGVINGYSSRLHYFTDWAADNEIKKVVRNISKDLSGEPSGKTIDFMSTRPASYRQLSTPEAVKDIVKWEEALTKRGFWYVPRTRLARILGKLRDGDIIGMTTSKAGLDVSHTGLIVVQNGVRKFLHAPLSGGNVQLTEGSFAEYVEGIPSMTGIVVVRPCEP